MRGAVDLKLGTKDWDNPLSQTAIPRTAYHEVTKRTKVHEENHVHRFFVPFVSSSCLREEPLRDGALVATSNQSQVPL